MTSIYAIKGELRTDRARGMADVADVLAEAMERAFGVSEEDYEVVVSGPPELHIGLVPR